MSDVIDKNTVDVSQAFLIFMATVGDVDRTAAALHVEPETIRQLAESEGWIEKVRRISVMSKSEKPGDYERATNRALNFVQAHQLREQVEKFLRFIRSKTNEELIIQFTAADRNGNRHISARFFSDIATALQKCHEMTYAALGDSIGERKVLGKPGDAHSDTAGMHAAVIAVLNSQAVPAEREAIEAATEDTVKTITGTE